ncbi:hypothetical protein [Pantanalinema sp. GBBB05]|uniref:hypothetical protein n=1 Tax=Pantanalinema sp. GBBB05 TaxID=2604139 RepID=UPI003D818919
MSTQEELRERITRLQLQVELLQIKNRHLSAAVREWQTIAISAIEKANQLERNEP